MAYCRMRCLTLPYAEPHIAAICLALRPQYVTYAGLDCNMRGKKIPRRGINSATAGERGEHLFYGRDAYIMAEAVSKVLS